MVTRYNTKEKDKSVRMKKEAYYDTHSSIQNRSFGFRRHGPSPQIRDTILSIGMMGARAYYCPEFSEPSHQSMSRRATSNSRVLNELI